MTLSKEESLMPGRNILVVDDEPGMRAMVAANLEIEGFAVTEAESGDRALEAAKSNNFDLVLTDIRMPGMNGVELFRSLRQLGMQMPVVLMTGFAVEELVKGALEEGVFTVLAKPFDVGHAIRTVSSAVPGCTIPSPGTRYSRTASELPGGR